MTPGARIAAAIECLDAILAGGPAEKVLTTWARRHRFAGSGDRAAIRDHVFGALRRLRSSAWLGGAMTGRAVMIGALRQDGADVAALLDGRGHAPPPPAPAELAERPPMPPAVALDMPDWYWPELVRSLGPDAEAVARALRDRAPVWLRVNLAKTTLTSSCNLLFEKGIQCEPAPGSDTALKVLDGARRIAGSDAYRDGLIELQDLGAQRLCAALPVAPGQTVFDACAGGGGKALALAARGAKVTAYDSDPRRMADLPARARRAGVAISVSDDWPTERFDLVVADVPCSGSGTWRRTPDAKWRLTPERLDALRRTQASILARASERVAPGGHLAYLTCAFTDIENETQVAEFMSETPDFACLWQRRLGPLDDCDGFFGALLKRER